MYLVAPHHPTLLSRPPENGHGIVPAAHFVVLYAISLAHSCWLAMFEDPREVQVSVSEWVSHHRRPPEQVGMCKYDMRCICVCVDMYVCEIRRHAHRSQPPSFLLDFQEAAWVRLDLPCSSATLGMGICQDCLPRVGSA